MIEKNWHVSYRERRAEEMAFMDFRILYGEGVDAKHLGALLSRVTARSVDQSYRAAFQSFRLRRKQLIDEILKNGLTLKGASKLAMIRIEKRR